MFGLLFLELGITVGCALEKLFQYSCSFLAKDCTSGAIFLMLLLRSHLDLTMGVFEGFIKLMISFFR